MKVKTKFCFLWYCIHFESFFDFNLIGSWKGCCRIWQWWFRGYKLCYWRRFVLNDNNSVASFSHTEWSSCLNSLKHSDFTSTTYNGDFLNAWYGKSQLLVKYPHFIGDLRLVRPPFKPTGAIAPATTTPATTATAKPPPTSPSSTAAATTATLSPNQPPPVTSGYPSYTTLIRERPPPRSLPTYLSRAWSKPTLLVSNYPATPPFLPSSSS